MTTAFNIVKKAYRGLNLIEPVTLSDFYFPQNIAVDIINEVISNVNRFGRFWFTETRTPLVYTSGVYQYNLPSLGIAPNRINYVRAESFTNGAFELERVSDYTFRKLYRSSSIVTGMPTAYMIFNSTFELSAIPNTDYSIAIYHNIDIPRITTTSDSFPIPDVSDDVLIECCDAILGQKIGKYTNSEALSKINALFAPFLVKEKTDTALPSSRPPAF